MVLSSPSSSSGLERDKFDNKTVSFEEHIKFEHNMWNYLYFIVLVRVKNKTDYTGPESYVAQMIKVWALEGVAASAGTDQGDLGVGWDSCGHLLKGKHGSRGAAGVSPQQHGSWASCPSCRGSRSSVVGRKPSANPSDPKDRHGTPRPWVPDGEVARKQGRPCHGCCSVDHFERAFVSSARGRAASQSPYGPRPRGSLEKLYQALAESNLICPISGVTKGIKLVSKKWSCSVLDKGMPSVPSDVVHLQIAAQQINWKLKEKTYLVRKKVLFVF